MCRKMTFFSAGSARRFSSSGMSVPSRPELALSNPFIALKLKHFDSSAWPAIAVIAVSPSSPSAYWLESQNVLKPASLK